MRMIGPRHWPVSNGLLEKAPGVDFKSLRETLATTTRSTEVFARRYDDHARSLFGRLAATTLAIIPTLLLFLAVQNRMAAGLTAGAVKGCHGPLRIAIIGCGMIGRNQNALCVPHLQTGQPIS